MKDKLVEDLEKLKSWTNHTRTFNPGTRPILGGKYSVTTEKAAPGKMFYKVHHPKEGEIGSFYVSGKDLNKIAVTNAGVETEHQRKGIGSAVYDMIEKDSKHTGMELHPQGNFETSDEAKAFWRKRSPQRAKETFGE